MYCVSITELGLLNGGGEEEIFRVSFPQDNMVNCRYSGGYAVAGGVGQVAE